MTGALLFAHIVGGPLDPVIEVGLPLGLFGAFWWWSTRSTRRGRGDGPKDKP